MIFKNKVKTMSLKEFLTLQKPVYKILQIIPDKSIRNYQSEEIASAICNLYKIPASRLKRNGFKITYNLPEKVSFFIDISINECKFYIICPCDYANLFKEKCNSIWNKATIIENNDFEFNWNNSKNYQVYYEKQDSLSLKVDKKCNQPLNNILDVLEIMQGTDQVGIMYNFIPCGQKGWRELHKETLDKFKAGKPMEKEFFNLFSILKYGGFAIQWILENALGIANDFLFNKDFGSTSRTFLEEVAISNLTTEQTKKISKMTREKGDEKILKTQIMVMSKSIDDKRKLSNAISVCESFKVLNENNSLTYKEVKPKKKNVFYVDDFKIAGVKENTMSTKECQNFIEIPAYTLIQKHKGISHVQTIQTKVPQELTKGVKCLGVCTYKDQHFKCYLRDDYNIGNLPLVILAPQNAGKTTFIANQIKDSASVGECNIVVDFIKNCELSKDVMDVINLKTTVVIDCATEDINKLEGFGYNEIRNINESEFKRMETANLQSKQILALIDSMNIEDKPLTGQMRRYLSASANICCLLGHINVGDAIECLQNHEIRMQYIEELKSKFNISKNKLLVKKINTLTELNEVDSKSGNITGTKNNNIKGILDRVSLLEEDLRMEMAFNKSCDDNINILECMEQGKNVFIMMPEHLFNDKISKNIMVTYWVSKIILAIKLRGSLHDKPLRCNVYVDEVYQVPIAEALIKETLAQTRKFGGHWVFSCHYLNQLPTIKAELKNSGASYMLLKGCDIKNYEELKDDLEPYTYEDMREMKQHQSMNLIQYENGYAKFITQLPPPIKEKKKQKGE